MYVIPSFLEIASGHLAGESFHRSSILPVAMTCIFYYFFSFAHFCIDNQVISVLFSYTFCTSVQFVMYVIPSFLEIASGHLVANFIQLLSILPVAMNCIFC